MTGAKQHPRLATEGVEDQVFKLPDRNTPSSSAATDALLLWGWPQLLQFLPITRRSLEKLISRGHFPKPRKYVGRRPFWLPADVIEWAQGGRP
jgi:predicted DNA-binding transcriptional regulator AlpA